MATNSRIPCPKGTAPLKHDLSNEHQELMDRIPCPKGTAPLKREDGKILKGPNFVFRAPKARPH